MRKVSSSDGTEITYSQAGSGPALLIVHGSGSSGYAWPANDLLKEHFTLFIMDRRGYGESGDHPEYQLEKEFDDICAVAKAINEPLFLIGHSFGALCTLEAALLADNIQKLVLYEPAMPYGDVSVYPPGLLDEMQDLMIAGKEEDAYLRLVRYFEIPEARIEEAMTLPDWPKRVTTVGKSIREGYAEDNYRFDPSRFQNMNIPTMLFVGSESPANLVEPSRVIDAGLPDSRIVVLEEQHHTAMYDAPDLFVHKLVEFFE